MGSIQTITAVQRWANAALLTLVKGILLFAAVNFVIWLYVEGKAPRKPTIEETNRQAAEAAIVKNGMDYYRRIYADKSDDEIRQLIYDQSTLPPALYEPYAEYRMPPMTLPSLNVHAAGFRLIGADQGPWPLDNKALNIFVFGSSMVLGVGVTDDETIPADIQRLLRERSGNKSINVYNFAVQAYASSQDVTWFQNQLRYGNWPDVAVFIGGWSDFAHWQGQTSVSELYRNYLNTFYQLNAQLNRDKGLGWHFRELLRSLPVTQFIEQQRNSRSQTETALAPAETAKGSANDRHEARTSEQIYASEYNDTPEIKSPERIKDVIDRYVVNTNIAEGIAKQLGISVLTVWQPIALYKYDLNYHPFYVQDPMRLAKYGYPTMAEYINTHDMGPNFLWCADIQEDVHKQLYLNHAHYNAEGSLLLARCVVDDLLRSGAIERALKHTSARNG